MTFRSTGCLLVAAVAAVAPVFGQTAGKGVRGSNVAVEIGSRSGTVLRGELIAVSLDSIWVLGDSGLAVAPLGYVRSASMKQHSLDGRTGLVWTLVGGLVTGGLLTAACASVCDDCGSVFRAPLGSWGIVGGVSALTLEGSSRPRFTTPDIGGKLRGYARFPQGLPAGLDRSAPALRVAVRTTVPLLR